MVNTYTILALTGAAGLGYYAWLEPHSLALLIFFPLLFFRGGRLASFSTAFAYYLVFARDVAHAVHQFFPDWPSWGGYAFLIADAALLSLPYLLVHGADHRRLIRLGLALGVSAIPPVAFFAWGSPLFLAADFFPGLGLVGIALGWLLLVATLGVTQGARWTIPVLALLAVSASARLHYQEPDPPAGWVGVDTHEPRMPPPEQIAERSARLSRTFVSVRQQISEGARVIVMPESIVGEWRPAVDFRAKALIPLLKESGATVLIGADLPLDNRGNRANGWVLVDGDGVRQISESRIPMPAGDWKLGLAPGARANPFTDDLVEIQGLSAAASICYEDYLLWPHFGLLTGQADVLVATANLWSVAGSGAPRIQSTARRALARLGGVPLIEAINH